MTNLTIEFTASNQELTNDTGVQLIASDTVGYIKASFSLEENWSGFDVIKAVWKAGDVVVSTILDMNSECLAPPEVLAVQDYVKVNLVGFEMDDDELTERLTTFQATAMNIIQKVNLEGQETQPVTPNQFEQYIAIIDEIIESLPYAAGNSF